VGAISFSPAADGDCDGLPSGGTEVLDYNGHGTMVASRGASNEYGACEDCRIVAVQSPMSVNLGNPAGSNTVTIAGMDWLTENASWIDVESNSWGPIAPGWEPTGQAGLLVATPPIVRAVERASAAHPSFWASGNGAAWRGGVLGHPTLLSPHFGPSAIIVGGHDSGYVNVWPGFPPHVVSDSCSAWGARHKSIDASAENVSGGTSGATPFVAGGAARILLEARRLFDDLTTGVGEGGLVASGTEGVPAAGPLADGALTKEELRAITFATATPRPAAQFEDGPPCATGQYGPTPVKWVDVPDGYPEFVHIGYGAVDGPALDLAFGVLRGEAPLPDRATTDAYFAADHQARSATHQVFSRP
jgi:hypothetical protein